MTPFTSWYRIQTDMFIKEINVALIIFRCVFIINFIGMHRQLRWTVNNLCWH
jgi:hypothetical protein